MNWYIAHLKNICLVSVGAGRLHIADLLLLCVYSQVRGDIENSNMVKKLRCAIENNALLIDTDDFNDAERLCGCSRSNSLSKLCRLSRPTTGDTLNINFPL